MSGTRHILCAAVVAGLAACASSSTGPTQPGPKTIHVTPDSASLAIGDSIQLVAVLDSAGSQVGGPAFTFASSDTLVATVTALGLVTAHGTGLASVTVSSGVLSAHIPIFILSGRVFIAGRPFGVAVSSLGQAYVTRQDDNALTRVAIGPDTITGTASVGTDPGDVVFNAAGTVAYVANFLGLTIGKIAVGSSSESDTAGVGGNAFHVRISSDGSRVYAASNNGFLYTLDATSLGRVDSVAIDADPNGLAIKNDTLAYVSSTGTGRVTELNLKGDSVLRYFAVHDTPQEVVLSADGGTLYVANQAGRVDVVNLGSGTIGTAIPVDQAFGMTRTAVGDTLIVTSLNGTVLKINAASRATIRTYPVGGTPRRVVVGPGGAILVANEGGWLDIIR